MVKKKSEFKTLKNRRILPKVTRGTIIIDPPKSFLERENSFFKFNSGGEKI